MEDDKYYIGTDLKYRIDISASGFDQDRDDYYMDVVCGNRKLSFSKEDVFEAPDGFKYFVIPTEEFRSGRMKLIVTAYVPDTDIPSGLRREVYVIPEIGYLLAP